MKGQIYMLVMLLLIRAMILEEATKEAFGYYPSELTMKSHKSIIAACEMCGEFRVIPRYRYRTFCKSCSKKGEKNPKWKPKIKRICVYCGKEFEIEQNVFKSGGGKYCSRKCYGATKHTEVSGRNNPNYKGGSQKRLCPICSRIFMAPKNRIKNGRGKYCSKLCYDVAQTGENNHFYTGGRKTSNVRAYAKRKKYGCTLLMPLEEGEAGHHITDEFVMGVPTEVHRSIGGFPCERHRRLVLVWLKDNDTKKYEMALRVL